MKDLSNNNEICTYHNMIRWLPLKEGYIKDFLVYDYDPNYNTSFAKIQILEVKSEKFQTENSGLRPVFIVTVLYKKSKSIHFIDQINRRIWKQELNDGKLILLFDE